jgi:hypothetical protein
VALVLTFGDPIPWTPYGLLKKLPVFDRLRVSSRYLVLLNLCLAMMAGVAVAEVGRLLRRLRPGADGEGGGAPWRRTAAVAAAWGLALVICVDLVTFGWVRLAGVFEWAPPASPTMSGFHHGRAAKRGDGFRWPWRLVLRNVGLWDCYEPAKPKRRGRVAIGPNRPLVRPLPPASGEVHILAWSPSSMTIEADLTSERPSARIAVNMNYDPNWTAGGGRARDHRGLLAVDVPTGRSTVQLRYRAAHFTAAALISGIAWPAAGTAFFILWRRNRRRHKLARLPSLG